MKKPVYLVSALGLVLILTAVLYLYLSHKNAPPNQTAMPPDAGQTPAVSTPTATASGSTESVTAPAAAPSPETTKFLNELQDPKTSAAEKIRIMAVLGKQKETDAFPILLAMLMDGPEKLKIEAALALARYTDPDSRLQVLDLLQDRCNDERLKSGIQVLKQADRHVDLSELKTLALHSFDLCVCEILALYAYDEERDVRLSVIEWLQTHNNNMVKQIFLRLLRDEEFQKTDELRLALFFALKQWKDDKEVVQCITENFDKEHYPDWM